MPPTAAVQVHWQLRSSLTGTDPEAPTVTPEDSGSAAVRHGGTAASRRVPGRLRVGRVRLSASGSLRVRVSESTTSSISGVQAPGLCTPLSASALRVSVYIRLAPRPWLCNLKLACCWCWRRLGPALAGSQNAGLVPVPPARPGRRCAVCAAATSLRAAYRQVTNHDDHDVHAGTPSRSFWFSFKFGVLLEWQTPSRTVRRSEPLPVPRPLHWQPPGCCGSLWPLIARPESRETGMPVRATGKGPAA